MPIANIQDAHEVERGLQTILAAPDADDRARAIRALFVDTPGVRPRRPGLTSS